MPMVDLTTTPGALDDATTQALAGELARIVLDYEAAPLAQFGDIEHMLALSWCFVDEKQVFMGGVPHDKPIYRVVFTVPEGAPLFGPLARRVRDRMFRQATEAVLAAEGTPYTPTDAHRVWVQLRSIADSQWGAFGDIITVNDLRDYAFQRDREDGAVASWYQAAVESARSASGWSSAVGRTAASSDAQ